MDRGLIALVFIIGIILLILLLIILGSGTNTSTSALLPLAMLDRSSERV